MTQKQALQWAIEKAREEGAAEVEAKLQEMYNALVKKSVKKESEEDKQLLQSAKDFLVGKGQIRCTAVADHLGVTQSKASALLKKLTDSGQITREKVGKSLTSLSKSWRVSSRLLSYHIYLMPTKILYFGTYEFLE